MGLQDLKMFWRSLLRQGSTTAINLIGLSIGFGAVLLIAAYVLHETSYDDWNPKADQVARVVINASFGTDQRFVAPLTSAPMAPQITREVNEITDYLRIDSWGGQRPVSHEDRTFLEDNILFVDSTFFQFFPYPMIQGDPVTALNRPNTCVITKETAQKYFKGEDPIGQELVFNNNAEQSYTVTAVLDESPGPTHLADFPMLCSWVTRNIPDDQSWLNNVNWDTYLMLQPGADRAAALEGIERVKQKYAAQDLETVGAKLNFSLQPLEKAYLHSSHFDFGGMQTGSIQQVQQFIGIGVLILLVAVLNFVNLTTAKSLMRGRQVGLSKVMGASRTRLIVRFLIESILFALVAMILGALVAVVAGPWLESALGLPVAWNPLERPDMLIGMLAAVLIVGTLAGLYPALYLTRFDPVTVLRGNLHKGRQGTKLRSSLVVIQFSVSIVLIIATVLVARQVHYMRTKDLGFDQEHVLVVRMLNWELMQKHRTFKQEVERLPGVVATATGDATPFEVNGNSLYHLPGEPDASQILLARMNVGYDFIDAMKLRIVEGRQFSEEIPTDSAGGAYVVNQAAARMLGWENPLEEGLDQIVNVDPITYEEIPVIGVVEDFHYNTLHTEVRPLILMIYRGHPRHIFVRLDKNAIPTTLPRIRELWADFAQGVPMDAHFLDEEFERRYQSELRTGRLFNFFTVLAIFVASLGLYALATFAAERRTREIGVRKVLGATESSLVHLLTGSFLRLVLIANVVAWPVAWYLMDRWMQNYAYRVDFGWWVFPLAGLAAVIVALITVGGQAWRASRVNPVRVLRTE